MGQKMRAFLFRNSVNLFVNSWQRCETMHSDANAGRAWLFGFLRRRRGTCHMIRAGQKLGELFRVKVGRNTRLRNSGCEPVRWGSGRSVRECLMSRAEQGWARAHAGAVMEALWWEWTVLITTLRQWTHQRLRTYCKDQPVN